MTQAAIVGTGYIAAVHAAALHEVGVEVAAVCGRTRERAEAFGRGRPYGDLRELLATEQVDAVHVCTPNDVHAEQALVALEHGAHVVCEKPLTVSTEESDRLVRAAAERGLVGATCYHARSYPLVEHMRAEAAAGALGKVTFVHGRYLCDDILYPASGWRMDPARSGPSYVVGDLGTHWLDLAEHVTGLRIAEVLADFRSFAGGPLEDYAALLLRFDGGASGSLVLSAGAAVARTSSCSSVKARAPVSPGIRSIPTRCSCVRPPIRSSSSSGTRPRTRRRPAGSPAFRPVTRKATATRSAISSPASTRPSPARSTIRTRRSRTDIEESQPSRPLSRASARAAGLRSLLEVEQG